MENGSTRNREIACVYHKKDLDGVASALVCESFLSKKDVEVGLYPYDYGDEIPDVSDYR